MNAEVTSNNTNLNKRNEKVVKQSRAGVGKVETVLKQRKNKPKTAKIIKDTYLSAAIKPIDDNANVYIPEPINHNTQLLLAYTYFLNDRQEKYVTVGYHPENFLPSVVLYGGTNCFIYFDDLQWMTLTTKKFEINDLFSNEIFNNNSQMKVSKNLQIYFGKNTLDENVVILYSNFNSILLSYSEWNKLMLLFDFINMIMMWNKTTSHQVEMYYKQYVSLCYEKNTLNLESSDFFSVVQTKSKINFVRLFHEIPIICQLSLNHNTFQ